MTEAQLKAMPEFRALPVYDEGDARANSITTPDGTAYRLIRECPTVTEVEECLRDPRLVPLGALRAGPDDQQVVVAYFGAKS